MKLLILAASAGLLAILTLVQGAMAPAAVRKNQAAMIIYEGKDRVLSLVSEADSASLAEILLRQSQGSAVAAERLSGRPCIGVALFSKPDWARLVANGRRPEDIGPADARVRLRVYPASATDSAAVQDVATGTAYVAIAFYPRRGMSSRWNADRWSVKAHADRASGACAVE